MEQINVIGQRIYQAILDAGFWIILISGLISILKHFSKREYEEMVKSIIYTGISFAGLYLVRTILETIRSTLV